MRRISILSFLLLIVLGGCRNKDLIRPGDPVNVAFDKSMELYNNEKYSEAAYGFDLVTRMGRGTNYAQDAQFYLAESYFKNRQYLLAASEYQRFMLYFPLDEKMQQVEFKLALSYYEQSPRYKLDQTTSYRAIELFQLFNTKYPESAYVLDAATYIDELRSKLAKKSFEAAQFYFRTSRYVAANVYYNQVLDQFPESPWAEESLLKSIESHILYADNSIEEKQIERYSEAIYSYEKYLQLFPQSEKRVLAEELYLDAQKKLASLNGSTNNALSSN